MLLQVSEFQNSILGKHLLTRSTCRAPAEVSQGKTHLISQYHTGFSPVAAAHLPLQGRRGQGVMGGWWGREKKHPLAQLCIY